MTKIYIMVETTSSKRFVGTKDIILLDDNPYTTEKLVADNGHYLHLKGVRLLAQQMNPQNGQPAPALPHPSAIVPFGSLDMVFLMSGIINIAVLPEDDVVADFYKKWEEMDRMQESDLVLAKEMPSAANLSNVVNLDSKLRGK